MENYLVFLRSIVELLITPRFLLLMAIFVVIGILLGALPGISVNMSLILALPLTYGMDTRTAMVVLLACYNGAQTGGLISAIMLNIPGTSSAMTTTFDGHPMALKGEGGRALGVGILTSVVGGTISFLLLIFLTPVIAKFAINFGPWEYFAIGIFSLTMITAVVGDDMAKGFLAALIGMALAMTGTDSVTNVIRFNFGNHALDGGVTTTALMSGFFAIPELLKLVMKDKDETLEVLKAKKFKGYGISFKEYLSQWKNILRSAFLGAYTGVLPGIGSSAASVLSYSIGKKRNKDGHLWGTGCVSGIIASETANNACIGGALIPMLALGVPGSTSAGILMSSLNLHGITTGPLVFQKEVNLVYMMFAVCFVANFLVLILERLMLNGFIKVLTLPRRIIMVEVMAMCFIGAYSSRSNPTDLIIFVVGGFLGYFLQKAGVKRAPIVLGYILCDIVEKNFRRGMSMTQMNMTPMFTSPIAMAFLLVAAFVMVRTVIQNIKAKKTRKAGEEEPETNI